MTLRRFIQSRTDAFAPKRVDTFAAEGAKCMTCLKPILGEGSVGGLEIVEGLPGDNKLYSRVLVRHHGAEELHEFTFESVEWDDHELKMRIHSHAWFDPFKQGETTGGRGT